MELGTPISEERVAQCFDADLDLSIAECVALYGDRFNDFPDAAQQVLVNMMFNMGRTRLAKFKNFRAALEDHDWKRAGVEGRDSLWYKQVTNRAERLMVRLESI
jgi:lysozyme